MGNILAASYVPSHNLFEPGPLQGAILVSLDSGQTWSIQDAAGPGQWVSITLSGLGLQFTAVQAINAYIFTAETTSTVLGHVYPFDPDNVYGSGDWTAIATDPGYHQIVAGQRVTGSGDPGETATLSTTFGPILPFPFRTGYWTGVAIAADGFRYVAVQRVDDLGNPGTIFIPFNPFMQSPIGYWSGVAASDDFQILTAVQSEDATGLPGDEQH